MTLYLHSFLILHGFSTPSSFTHGWGMRALIVLSENRCLRPMSSARGLVNSRPLTFVSLESADDEAITPNHFFQSSVNGIKDVCHDGGGLGQRCKLTQLFADRFWQSWLVEYTPNFTKRDKWFQKRPPLRIGDNVIVVAQNLQNLRRFCWPKEIII